MISVPQNKASVGSMTLEDYLNYQDATGRRYELIEGELAAMTPPSWLHFLIADYLATAFKQAIARLNQPWIALQGTGQQTKANTARLPDVAVVPLEAIADSIDQSAVLQVASILVVEIVSDSTAAQDYREKVTEYQNKGIREYWVVDPGPFGAAKYIGSPKRPRVSVYSWVDGVYQVRRFRGNEQVISSTFPALGLTAEQILGAGR